MRPSTNPTGRGSALRRPALACLALLPLSGCGDGEANPALPREVHAELSDGISTVINVRWATPKPTIGYVEYGPTEAMELNTPLGEEATTEHQVPLLGLPQDTEIFYRVVTWDGDRAGVSPRASLTTGFLPRGIPPLRVTGEGHGGYILAPILGATTAVTVINAAGQIVWYHTDERDLDIYRVRLSVDGESILFNAASVSGDPAENSELVRVLLDGSGTSALEVPLLAHDFVELPDGTLGAMAVEYREFEGSQLRGDKLVEVSPDGEIATIWSAWDCFDPAELPGDEPQLGWTFANALDYDAAKNVYYLGLRNFSSIVQIDRETGACDWVFGLYGNTFEFAAGSANFLHQHQFEVRADSILVFDNEGSADMASRVIEYAVDFEAATAREVWRYQAEPPVYTFVLGEPQRLRGGDVLINWGSAGQLERVTPKGESVWRLNSMAGIVFGFNTVADSLYSGDALP